MKVSEVYEAAADYIEQHGWHKGWFENQQGQVCLLGAINRVTNYSPFYESDDIRNSLADTEANMIAVLHLQAELEPMPVSKWNDAEERTEQEVLDLLRRMAKEHADE